MNGSLCGDRVGGSYNSLANDHFDKIPQTELIAQIPAYAQNDLVPIKVTAHVIPVHQVTIGADRATPARRASRARVSLWAPFAAISSHVASSDAPSPIAVVVPLSV